jgi:hypothetical protein
MAMSRALAGAAIGITLMLTSANAASNTTVLGAGAVSCGTWLEHRRDDHDSEFLVSWVLGYISALNQTISYSHNLTRGTDTGGITAWVDNYCATHPLDSLAAASTQLGVELLKSDPPPPSK